MIAVTSRDEEALVGALARDGVIVSSRDGNVRISPHFYNTSADVNVVLSSLRSHRELLA